MPGSVSWEKEGNLQHKVSLWIFREDAQELSKINYSVLTKYFEGLQDAVLIYTTMVMGRGGGYRPALLVEYDQMAYTYPVYDMRITVDMNLRSSESNISEKPGYMFLMKEEVVIIYV